MPKLKNHSGTKKRFRKSKKAGSKVYIRRCAKRNHILTKKSTKRKRHLRSGKIVSVADVNRITQMLPME